MSEDRPAGLGTTARLLVAGALAAGAGIPLSSARLTPWLILALVGLLAALAYHLWDSSRGPGAALAALHRRWLELPGARASGPLMVDVHDGVQPLRIRITRRGRTSYGLVTTPLLASTVAFRLWPAEAPPPGFLGSATLDGPPDLARAVGVEARFAHVFRAESNLPLALDAIVTADLMAPLLAVRREAPTAFRGVTWDGRELGVHWAGPQLTDPTRTLQLSRPIWRAFADA